MKNKLKYLLLSMCMLILCGCSHVKEDIVGNWTSSINDVEYTYTFNHDKTGKYSFARNDITFSYNIRKDELYVDYDNDTSEKYSIVIEDDLLILKDKNGVSQEFFKQ